jgi:hypothetical protein
MSASRAALSEIETRKREIWTEEGRERKVTATGPKQTEVRVAALKGIRNQRAT